MSRLIFSALDPKQYYRIHTVYGIRGSISLEMLGTQYWVTLNQSVYSVFSLDLVSVVNKNLDVVHQKRATLPPFCDLFHHPLPSIGYKYSSIGHIYL